MMKRDVLFLCQFFHPEHNSSATLPADTAFYLASQGLKVDALCGYPKEYSTAGKVPMTETVNGVNIRRIRYVQMGRFKKLGRLVNYFSFVLSALLHTFELRKYKSVIVYSNPPILPLVAVLGNMLFGTKIVFVAFDVYPEVAFASGSLVPGSIIDKGMRLINRMMYARASCVVALTDEMKRFLLQNRPQISEDRIVVIPNWAHEKRLPKTEDAHARFGYAQDQFIVSYFGNMGICQDMETYMGAAEALRDDEKIRFLIVGHGTKSDAVRRRIEEKRLDNVQLIGFLTGEAFEQAVAISDCCVVSLEKGLKGTCAPSKFYSYLQGGHPVLAVVEKGSYLEEEVEREQIGRAVELGNVPALVKAIRSMADDREGCLKMGERALALYEETYDYAVAMRKYHDMFKGIL